MCIPLSACVCIRNTENSGKVTQHLNAEISKSEKKAVENYARESESASSVRRKCRKITELIEVQLQVPKRCSTRKWRKDFYMLV